jgi:hypothetical protein
MERTSGQRLAAKADNPPVVQLQSTVPRFVFHPATRRDSTTAPPLTDFPYRKIRGISMARISAQTHFSMLLHRAGSAPDTQGHGLIGKRLVWESANC